MNYEKMWHELKRELEDLETHYAKLRLYHARQGHPTTATKFKERGDGVGEALMYMELAEDSPEFAGR